MSVVSYPSEGAADTGDDYAANNAVALYGPPAPQSNSRGYDRIKGLEAAILLRRNEADALRQRREALRELAAARCQYTAGIVTRTDEKGNAVPPRAVAKAHQQQQQRAAALAGAENGELEEDPSAMPIVRLCTATDGSFSILNVPPERYGDTCIEMDVAAESLRRHTELMQKSAAAMASQSHAYERQQSQLADQIRLMCDLTGMPIGAASARAANTSDRHLRRNAEAAANSSAPGHRLARILDADHEAGESERQQLLLSQQQSATVGHHQPQQNRSAALRSAKAALAAAGPSTALSQKQQNDELRAYLHTLSRETREAKAVALKKEKALKALEAQLAAQRAVEAETLSLYNAIRVEDRNVRERKGALRAALEEHDRLDALINSAAVAKSASSVGVMSTDLAIIRARVAECADEERRLQDRISKAQEYRIAMLHRRIGMIVGCVESHRLSADVEMLIAATLELQRQQDVSASAIAAQQQQNSAFAAGRGGGAAQSSTTSTATTTTGAIGKASRITHSTISSTNGSGGARTTATGKPLIKPGQLVIANASHKQAAQEIASLRREELYDVDAIIPPNETIHPAIYSIFVSEKEQLARRAVTTKLLAEEKMAAVAAQQAKVSNLEGRHARVGATLHRSQKNIKVVEDQKKLDLLEEVTGNRALLQEAMRTNVRLSRLAKELRPAAAAAQEEAARRQLRRATVSGGYGGGGGSPSSRGLTPTSTPIAPPLATFNNEANFGTLQ